MRVYLIAKIGSTPPDMPNGQFDGNGTPPQMPNQNSNQNGAQ